MNNLELATYLSYKGYKLFKTQGVEFENILVEGLNDGRPIDYEKLEEIAQKEGFSRNENRWIRD